MQSKFIKSSKAVNRMLSEGRISDLANYIKLGNSIDDLFLLTESDELKKHGVSIHILSNKNLIHSLNHLLEKLKNDESLKNIDRSLLKHYGFVLERTLQLWKENKLGEKCPILDRELDERAVTYLMKTWDRKSDCRNPLVSHIDSEIIRHVDLITTAIKSGITNSYVSKDQLGYYTRQLENELLESWESNHKNFKEIKTLLVETLKDIILEDAKASKLGKVLLDDVMNKFRDVLTHHITIVDDLSRYPALDEKFNSISYSLQGGKANKNVTQQAIETILKTYTQFDKKVQADINTLFRDEVIPPIIESHHIPIDLRRCAVSRVISDQRNNAVSLVIGNYITTLLNSSVAAKIAEDIRLDQGLFKGVVEKIIRQALYAFKHNSGEICNIIPDPEELFRDIYSLITRLENSIDVHKAADARIRQLERGIVELTQAFNQLKAEQISTAQPSVHETPPPVEVVVSNPTTSASRGLMGFFDRTTASSDLNRNAGSAPTKSNNH